MVVFVNEIEQVSDATSVHNKLHVYGPDGKCDLVFDFGQLGMPAMVASW